ncbi:MAG: hypothetical protein WA116_02245 [Anaerolineaceae bacterium]
MIKIYVRWISGQEIPIDPTDIPLNPTHDKQIIYSISQGGQVYVIHYP